MSGVEGHRLGVIAAMHEEAEALFARLDARGERVHSGRRDFLVAHTARREVVVVVSRVGKVSAAATAAELIVGFGVDELLVTGVAGGIGAGVGIGDVVVADELVQHDLDARPLWPRHVVPLLEMARFSADPRLAGELEASARSFLERRGGGHRVHRGLVATGDRFIGSEASLREVRAIVPDALCVEMEGAAVAQVAAEHGVPFAVVRAISDRADAESGVRFVDSLAGFAAGYALGIALPLIEHEVERG